MIDLEEPAVLFRCKQCGASLRKDEECTAVCMAAARKELYRRLLIVLVIASGAGLLFGVLFPLRLNAERQNPLPAADLMEMGLVAGVAFAAGWGLLMAILCYFEWKGDSRSQPVCKATPAQISTAPCPYCGKPLRTSVARQCCHCGSDWH
jgi:hypothetical protein